jgi:hypothetical protein
VAVGVGVAPGLEDGLTVAVWAGVCGADGGLVTSAVGPKVGWSGGALAHAATRAAISPSRARRRCTAA